MISKVATQLLELNNSLKDFPSANVLTHLEHELFKVQVGIVQ
jgi:hypothetical protein